MSDLFNNVVGVMLFAGTIALAISELISDYAKRKASEKMAKRLNILRTLLLVVGLVSVGLPMIYGIGFGNAGRGISPYLFWFMARR